MTKQRKAPTGFRGGLRERALIERDEQYRAFGEGLSNMASQGRFQDGSVRTPKVRVFR